MVIMVLLKITQVTLNVKKRFKIERWLLLPAQEKGTVWCSAIIQ